MLVEFALSQHIITPTPLYGMLGMLSDLLLLIRGGGHTSHVAMNKGNYFETPAQPSAVLGSVVVP